MTETLTALVPCKNERANIRGCIDSFRGLADEILIADSGSTDGTLDIVRSLGACRIIEREYITSGDFKNWAIPQATHPWILLVDADERVTPQLARELQQKLRQGPECDGYWIARNNYFLGHRVRFGAWRKDKVLRFFDRNRGRYEGPSDHGEIHVSSGNVGRLTGRLDHYTYESYEQYLRKLQRYTWLQARQWHDQGRAPSVTQLLLRAPFRFLRDYFFQLGFLDGAVGLQLAMMSAFYSFLKQARLWEECYAQKPQLPDASQTHCQSTDSRDAEQPVSCRPAA